jgi:hypothetical protein
MAENSEWGPLAGLIGEWEGDQGVDFSFHNVEGEVGETKYREKVSMKPFGPVDNGTQHLYGLDYRMGRGAARKRTRSTPRSATGSGTATPVK